MQFEYTLVSKVRYCGDPNRLISLLYFRAKLKNKVYIRALENSYVCFKVMVAMKLNVGCGSDIWGDTRVDVTRCYWTAKGRSSANLLADARYLPFKDKYFDELRIHEVLEHIKDWKKALNESCRVSKKISITVPINSYVPKNELFLLFVPGSFPFRNLWRLPQRTREHIWQFDIKKIEYILRKSGFRNVSTEVVHYPVFSLIPYRLKEMFFRYSWKIIAF